MTDLAQALAAAREAIAAVNASQHNATAFRYRLALAKAVDTLRDLLAALDAAQPVADDANSQAWWDGYDCAKRLFDVPTSKTPPAAVPAADIHALHDIAVEAYGKAAYRWDKMPSDDRDEPRNFYALRAVAEAIAADQAPPAAPNAWAEGYKQGVQDERTSEANIGICGFGGKVEPARENPYGEAPLGAAPPFNDEDLWRIEFYMLNAAPDGQRALDALRRLMDRLYDATLTAAGSPSISVQESAQTAAREALRWRDETRPVQAPPASANKETKMNDIKCKHEVCTCAVPHELCPHPLAQTSESVPPDVDSGLLGAIARGWCHPRNTGKNIDPDLAESIAREVLEFLGLSTQAPPAAVVNPEGVLSAVERAISKGYCPTAIEEAYEQYEAECIAMLTAERKENGND